MTEIKHKYQVVYADPPWWYNKRNTDTKFGGGAGYHYPLMKNSELLQMSNFVQSISDNNCALFLWSTMPKLPFAIELMDAWGFSYSTAAFVWVKITKSGKFVQGPGNYTASNTEIVLLGVRGSMPVTENLVPQIVCVPRHDHSVKPEEVALRINRMYPTAKKAELFARRKTCGWDCYGNQLNGWDANA